MSGRLPSGVVVAALLRRVNDDGGMAMVRARGDAQAGAILVIADDGPGGPRVLERGLNAAGDPALIESLPAGGDVESYWRRRRDRDRDLWVIELTTPSAERFAAETMSMD